MLTDQLTCRGPRLFDRKGKITEHTVCGLAPVFLPSWDRFIEPFPEGMGLPCTCSIGCVSGFSVCFTVDGGFGADASCCLCLQNGGPLFVIKTRRQRPTRAGFRFIHPLQLFFFGPLFSLASSFSLSPA